MTACINEKAAPWEQLFSVPVPVAGSGLLFKQVLSVTSILRTEHPERRLDTK